MPIKTADELMNMKSDGKYRLVCDIDLSEIKWKPIKSFSGCFDGEGHSITGLSSDTYGLFSDLSSGATVMNVVLSDVYITSKYKNVGAVVSVIPSSEKNIIIDRCSVSGLVSSCQTKNGRSSTSTVGGIVGKNNSPSAVISNCCSNAVVASERVAGGIAGTNYGAIEKCGFGGQIVNSYNIYELCCDSDGIKKDDFRYLYAVGGITGFNYGEITDCYNIDSQIEIASFYGGISGANNGKINRCVNSSDILYDYEAVGGMITGYVSNTSTVTDCYTKKPDRNTVSSDVGKGRSDSVTYAFKISSDLHIKSLSKLDDTWMVYNGTPVLKAHRKLLTVPRVYVIKGERVIKY